MIVKQEFCPCKQEKRVYTTSAMAHKKAGGSTTNGRDSRAKRRGVKRFGGQIVNAGEILIRQKGFWYLPGPNTHVGKDWTIHADIDGVVKFAQKRKLKFNGSRDRCTMVFVEAVASK
jgi:large subunit ribosomal protein L27